MRHEKTFRGLVGNHPGVCPDDTGNDQCYQPQLDGILI